MNTKLADVWYNFRDSRGFSPVMFVIGTLLVIAVGAGLVKGVLLLNDWSNSDIPRQKAWCAAHDAEWIGYDRCLFSSGVVYNMRLGKNVGTGRH